MKQKIEEYLHIDEVSNFSNQVTNIKHSHFATNIYSSEVATAGHSSV